MTTVEKLIATACEEIGYLEKASNSQLDGKTDNVGKSNYTKYARDLDEIGYVFNGKKNGYEWCAVYGIWCFVKTFGVETAMKMLNLPQKSLAAGVKYLAGYFKSVGRFFTNNPEPGDFIFFYGVDDKNRVDTTKWAHTGLVERVDGSKAYTIEGNTSGASGVISNGGGVARKSYSLIYNRIAGYGRPDWSLADGSASDNTFDNDEITVNYQGKVIADSGLRCRTTPVDGVVLTVYPNGTVVTITKENNGWGFTGMGWVSLAYISKIGFTEAEDDDMDQSKFNEMFNTAMTAYRKTLQDNDCGAWSEEDRQWAINSGLIVGSDSLPDGTPNYMWADQLTREQAVVLFHRFAKLMGKA